jgi:hypothetical protein
MLVVNMKKRGEMASSWWYLFGIVLFFFSLIFARVLLYPSGALWKDILYVIGMTLVLIIILIMAAIGGWRHAKKMQKEYKKMQEMKGEINLKVKKADE